MSIKTVYVQAKSKAEINRELKINPHKYEALQFSIFEGNDVFALESLPDGTVVKIFEKYVQGQPYAKAYGTIKRDKLGKVTLR